MNATLAYVSRAPYYYYYFFNTSVTSYTDYLSFLSPRPSLRNEVIDLETRYSLLAGWRVGIMLNKLNVSFSFASPYVVPILSTSPLLNMCTVFTQVSTLVICTNNITAPSGRARQPSSALELVCEGWCSTLHTPRLAGSGVGSSFISGVGTIQSPPRSPPNPSPRSSLLPYSCSRTSTGSPISETYYSCLHSACKTCTGVSPAKSIHVDPE